MAKLTLNPITSGYSSNTAYNINNDLIEAATENTLSRDGTAPNTMEADFDMNSNRIINLAAPVVSSDAARLADVTAAISGLPTAAMVPNTPSGTIAATNVQAAINELDSEKAALAGSASQAFATAALTSTSITAPSITTAKTTIASATTPDIFAVTTGQLIDYTGTATCTGFVAAPQAGMFRELYCAGACLFTAGANLLIEGIPSGTTITLAADALVQVRAITTTQFKMTYSLSGSFSYSNTTDWSVTKNITVTYSVQNGVVTIHTPTLSGTSISGLATITTAAPACIVPASSSDGASGYGENNSAYVYNITFRVLSNRTIDFILGAGNWTSSGTKTILQQSQTYALF